MIRLSKLVASVAVSAVLLALSSSAQGAPDGCFSVGQSCPFDVGSGEAFRDHFQSRLSAAPEGALDCAMACHAYYADSEYACSGLPEQDDSGNEIRNLCLNLALDTLQTCLREQCEIE